MEDSLQYMCGFGSHVSTEAIPNALPKGQNSPQEAPFGLYAEQLSGTAFTAARHRNLRSWLYRIRPSVIHTDFTGPLDHTGGIPTSINDDFVITPNQLRWSPLELDTTKDKRVDFVDGMSSVAGAGDPSLKEGC